MRGTVAYFVFSFQLIFSHLRPVKRFKSLLLLSRGLLSGLTWVYSGLPYENLCLAGVYFASVRDLVGLFVVCYEGPLKILKCEETRLLSKYLTASNSHPFLYIPNTRVAFAWLNSTETEMMLYLNCDVTSVQYLKSS